MTGLLIAYLIGVVVNTAIAVIVWRDLVAEKMLEKARIFVIILFVLLSFGTWIYSIIYIAVSVLRNLRPRKKEDDESDVH